ncbi:MAG: hypothetical protein AAGD06_26660 [Acidobacteriota bacterium]
MPISIREKTEQGPRRIDWLCDDEWNLIPQLEALGRWLRTQGAELKPGDYWADVGFSPRPGAAGGGGLVSLDMMRTLIEIGMSLYLSEYPPFEDDEDGSPSGDPTP